MKNCAWFPHGVAPDDAHDVLLSPVAAIDKRATEAEVPTHGVNMIDNRPVEILADYYTGANVEQDAGGVGSGSLVKRDADGVDCDDASDGDFNFDGENDISGVEHTDDASGAAYAGTSDHERLFLKRISSRSYQGSDMIDLDMY